jgi:hypothetical protein
MQAGDTALIPDDLAHLAARFRSDPPPLQRRDLILVAVLLDQHDTPGAAIDAGYEVFEDDLPDEVASQLLALSSPDSTVQDAAIQTIQTDLQNKVDAAIQAKLSVLDEVFDTQDRTIGFDHVVFEQVAASQSFTLHFQTKAGDSFAIDARMLMTIDPCEDLIVEVESLQQGIQNAEGALKQLANAHGGEPTAQDEQEMEQTRQALFKLRARLKDAEDQLKQCRERIRPVGAERL